MALTLPRAVVERVARWGVRPILGLPVPLARRAAGAMGRLNLVGEASVERAELGGVPGELVRPPGATGPPRVLYLHGGAYRIASPATHRNVVAALARASANAVFAADYRLAPEHPAPAALDDAVAAMGAMAERAGAPVVLAGDSAGGGLSLASAVAARDGMLASVAGLALISPWVDLTLSGPSYTANASRDALLTMRVVTGGAADYAVELGPADPRCSPLFADLRGLPPLLIQAGANELLRSDAEALAERVRDAGGEVTLEVADGLWHDYHVHAGILRDADQALARMGAWIAQRLA